MIFENTYENALKYSYRLIIEDIHVEGVFPVEQQHRVFIKLISKCAGNVFIETKYRNGLPFSKTTNNVLIGEYPLEKKEEINRICKILSTIILNSIVVEDYEPQIIQAPSNLIKEIGG